uniref:DDE-1 domain-containing protein n=1 Tax=Hippocampus comes TaxID=109280 RepID=A0A3Q2XF98_HIPCM
MVIQRFYCLWVIVEPTPHQPYRTKIIFFPPNTTSHLRPMDAGVIQNVKLHYRKCMLRSILLNMDECNKASELVKRITIKDAIHWIELGVIHNSF